MPTYDDSNGLGGLYFNYDNLLIPQLSLYELGEGDGNEFIVFAVISGGENDHGKFIGTDNGGYDRSYGRDQRADGYFSAFNGNNNSN